MSYDCIVPLDNGPIITSIWTHDGHLTLRRQIELPISNALITSQLQKSPYGNVSKRLVYLELRQQRLTAEGLHQPVSGVSDR